MRDQHNQRRLTVGAFVVENVKQGATVMPSMPPIHVDDSTYIPQSVEKETQLLLKNRLKDVDENET